MGGLSEAPPHEPVRGTRVIFTARGAGNLSSHSGPRREEARRTRERLRARLGLDALLHTRQVHGSSVAVVAAPHPREIEADGQATTLSGIGLMVLTADCLPIVLASESAVAVLHAGWRGLAAGVVEAGVARMRELDAAAAGGGAGAGGWAPVALIGPGAGGCCYEVGPEVRGALGAEGGPAGSARGGPAPMDLKAIAAARLRAAGIETIRDANLCTICDERFFSHRREGASAGRQAVVAWRT
jgi:YfiH family protein